MHGWSVRDELSGFDSRRSRPLFERSGRRMRGLPTAHSADPLERYRSGRSSRVGCRETLDLIVALRNVTRCSIQSLLLTRSRSSSSRGLAEVIGKHGQFCSRYRAGHLLLHRTHHGRGADRHLIQTRIPFKVRPRRWYAWFVCLVRRTRPRAATRHLSIQTSLNRASSPHRANMALANSLMRECHAGWLRTARKRWLSWLTQGTRALCSAGIGEVRLDLVATVRLACSRDRSHRG